MKNNALKLVFFLSLVLLMSVNSRASGSKNHWIISTQQGDTITSSRLNRIINDTLFFSCENCKGKIFVGDVTGLLRVKYPRYGRNIIIGTLSGSFVGMVLGAVAGPNETDPYFGIPSYADFNALGIGIIVGTIAGAATGLIISLVNNKDKFYDFSDKNIMQKEVALRNLFVEK